MQQGRLPRRERDAARVLLLDGQDRMLLLCGRDPSLPDEPAWWFTPGGGVDRGEDPEAALRRECWEELGHIPQQLHGPIARRCHDFAFNGVWLVQHTAYYWARCEGFEPRPQRLSDLERRFILGWRWWPVVELRRTEQTVYPTDLSEILDRVPPATG